MQQEDLMVRAKITIHNRKADTHAAALGGGVARLCELVDEMGSLNKAAHEMGMAYSKAWRIMKTTEEILDVTLIERHGPKGSVLTSDGRRLLICYREVQLKVADYGNRVLAEALEREFG